MNILITGGTGFIGHTLVKTLTEQGHAVTVLSRSPDKVARLCVPNVNALADLSQLNADDRFQTVVNLAGEPLLDGHWTKNKKQRIRSSRIGLTEHLVTAIERMTIKPELLISGSAVGYYGNRGDTVLTEQSPANDDFAARLCADWEAAALQAERLGVRVCLIRTGLVIADGGGFLQRMLPPFRLGLGGRLGDGRQWMSWIHRRDWINIALAMIADASMRGAYNATAPNPVTNAEFTRILAQCLNRPALLPVPTWAMKLLLGEMAELVLGSQRVLPERLLNMGFQFEYADIAPALTEALSHRP